MKVIVNRVEFIKAIKTVKFAARKTPSGEKYVYDAVAIAAGLTGDGGAQTLRLACANPDQPLSITTVVDANIGDERGLPLAVNVRMLLRVLAAIGGETVSLETEGYPTPLLIKALDTTYQIQLQTLPLDMAYVAQVPFYNTTTTSAPGLLNAASRVWFAASDDSARPTFQCLYFDGVSVAATDGFRIAVLSVPVPNVKGLIPEKALRLAKKLLDGEAPVMVGSGNDGSKFVVSDGYTTITTNAVSGSFPDYNAIIPKRTHFLIEFDVEELHKALEMVKVTQKLNNQNPFCVMKIETDNGGGGGLMACVTTTAGSAEVLFQATVPATSVFREPEFQLPFTIGFNAMYLDTAIRHANCDRVGLTFNAYNLPVIIKPAGEGAGDDNPYTAVIMPMHIG